MEVRTVLVEVASAAILEEDEAFARPNSVKYSSASHLRVSPENRGGSFSIKIVW